MTHVENRLVQTIARLFQSRKNWNWRTFSSLNSSNFSQSFPYFLYLIQTPTLRYHEDIQLLRCQKKRCCDVSQIQMNAFVIWLSLELNEVIASGKSQFTSILLLFFFSSLLLSLSSSASGSSSSTWTTVVFAVFKTHKTAIATHAVTLYIYGD